MKQPLLDLTPADFSAWMALQGQPGFRARQVLAWIADRRADGFGVMTDLPRSLREQLDAEFTVFGTSIEQADLSPDGTSKLLLSCQDGRRVECVLMREADRRTVCLSTQVGCAMGCVFCASGLKGVERNLTRAEILEQLLQLQRLLPEEERVSNIVVMGMGESLANLDNLLSALDWVCSPDGMGVGQRRVTISTVGLPEKMKRLAEADRQYHLAVSLHAARESVRDHLVPINQRIGLDAVMAAADAYFQKTGRQVTFEYVVLAGLNDRPEDVQALVRLMAGRKSHVNLIPYNPVPGLPFERPSPDALRDFVTALRGRGVSVTVRKTKGRPIDAACGQLRRRFEDTTSRTPAS